MPDLDAIPGIFAGDFARYHNQASHSLVSGLFIGLLAGLAVVGILRQLNRATFFRWFLIFFTAYDLHVIMDFFTRGRGVMLFWPVSSERYISPYQIFLGVRWSEGLFSFEHVLTLTTELVFVVLVIWVQQVLERRWDARQPSSKARVSREMREEL